MEHSTQNLEKCFFLNWFVQYLVIELKVSPYFASHEQIYPFVVDKKSVINDNQNKPTFDIFHAGLKF